MKWNWQNWIITCVPQRSAWFDAKCPLNWHCMKGFFIKKSHVCKFKSRCNPGNAMQETARSRNHKNDLSFQSELKHWPYQYGNNPDIGNLWEGKTQSSQSQLWRKVYHLNCELISATRSNRWESNSQRFNCIRKLVQVFLLCLCSFAKLALIQLMYRTGMQKKKHEKKKWFFFYLWRYSTVETIF